MKPTNMKISRLTRRGLDGLAIAGWIVLGVLLLALVAPSAAYWLQRTLFY